MVQPSQSSRPLVEVLSYPELANSQIDMSNEPNQTYKLSKRRWAVLFAVTLFGFTGALVDETNPILNTICELLGLDLKQYVYISQLFGYVPLLNTILTTWFLDKYGIKVTLYVATVIMIVRNTFRALLYSPDLPGWAQFKILYWVIASIASVQVLSIFYCTPLKISEGWFSASERSFAWTIMVSSTSFGVSLAAFVLPRVVHEVSDIKPLADVNIIFGIITAVTILVCVTRSEPENPPSERMIKSSSAIPYLESVKSVFRHKDIALHLFQMAILDGLYITIATLMQPILSASGHSRIFIGNLISINALVNLIATISLATQIHKVTNITINCKLASVLSSFFFCLRLYFMLYPFSDTVVLVVSLGYCLCNGWALPNFNNMTAHVTCGVVSQGTISGLIAMIVIVVVSLCRSVFVSLMRRIDGKEDYTYSVLFTTSLIAISTTIYLLFFEGKSPESNREENNSVLAR